MPSPRSHMLWNHQQNVSKVRHGGQNGDNHLRVHYVPSGSSVWSIFPPYSYLFPYGIGQYWYCCTGLLMYSLLLLCLVPVFLCNSGNKHKKVFWIQCITRINAALTNNGTPPPAISQTTLSNAFSWMKIFEFQLKFHWNLFLRVQLTIFQHWLS